jgi:hypothetical protein
MTFEVIAAARRRARRTGLVALLAVTVLACCLVLVIQHSAGDPTAPVRTVSASPSPIVSTFGDGLLPDDVAWARVSGVDLPISPTAGPADTSAGLALGFAHTPAGALLAALHLLVRTTPQVGPAVFEPTLASQVVGESAPAMRQAVTDDYQRAAAAAGISYGQPLGDLPAALEGARIDAYSDEHADLSVLTAIVDDTGTTRYAGTSVTVDWVEQDWRLVAPPTGRWDGQVYPVDPSHITAFTALRDR